MRSSVLTKTLNARGTARLASERAKTYTFLLWVAALDIDGDGDLDLVSANWASSILTVFLGRPLTVCLRDRVGRSTSWLGSSR